jgi:hypothetical protein
MPRQDYRGALPEAASATSLPLAAAASAAFGLAAAFGFEARGVLPAAVDAVA